VLKFRVLTKNSFLIIMSLIISFGTVFAYSPIAKADTISDLQSKLNSIQKNIDKQTAILKQKQAEKNTLENKIAQSNTQIYQTQLKINQTQTEIGLTQSEINKLVEDIKTKENEIKSEKEKMAKAAIVLYQEQDRSMIEIMLSSNSINEVIDRTEYLNAVQKKIDDSMAQITKIKVGLENNKKDQELKQTTLESEKGKLLAQKSGLNAQKNELNSLLAQTKGEEAKYQTIVDQIKKEKNSVDNSLRLALLAAAQEKGGLGGGGSSGGYPSYLLNAAQDTVVDPWGFLNRECTSYAAWKWNNVYGRPWYRGTGPAGTGNAKNWASILASRNGYSWGYEPRVSSIAVWEGGSYGHVAIVEKINTDGTFNVSEYNVLPGQYSERYNLSKTSSFGYAIKFIYGS
jgi:peptidoglycan hydrolase CwlO-like protein